MLSALGITRWRLRGETKKTPRFVILADSTQADKELLTKIIQALKVEPTDCEIHWIAEPATLKNLSIPAVPVIAFGEALTPYLPAQAIKSMGLSLLAQNPPAKKALWNQLKSLG